MAEVTERAMQASAGGIALSRTAWVPEVDLDMREWVTCGRRLGALGRGIAWWIGDWLRYGNARYGEKYSRAARLTGYDAQSLMNMAYVASRFDVSRRREQLSWSHHAEVAALDSSTQDRWLDLAQEQNLSVHSLRLELRSARRAESATEEDPGSITGPSERTPDAIVCPKCMHVIRAQGPASS